MLRAGNIHETTVEQAGPKGFTTDRIENFFLPAGDFQRAVFLARIISAIDRFSILHISLLFQKRRQVRHGESVLWWIATLQSPPKAFG